MAAMANGFNENFRLETPQPPIAETPERPLTITMTDFLEKTGSTVMLR